MIDLKGQWAIVTGASSGIGLEFSRQLAAMGCNLLMVSNQPKELAETSESIERQWGVKAQTLDVDLTAPDAVERVAAAADSLPQYPLILINNAGIFDFARISSLSPRRLNLYIDLHIRSVTLMCQAIGDRMGELGRGYILNMSSMSCWMPMPGITMYSATKAYIRVFSRAYRVEMLPKGVSVTVACPGGIATDLFGLPRNLQRLGVRVQALATPQGFVKRALRRMFRRKAQYINGMINRVAIVAVGSMPERARRLVDTQILSRYGK